MIKEICERFKQPSLSNEEFLRPLWFDQSDEKDEIQSAFEREVRGITGPYLRSSGASASESASDADVQDQ